MSFNLIRSICCCQLRLFFIYFFVHICLRQLFATSQRWRQRTKDKGRRQKVEGRIVIEPRNFSNSAALSCKWTTTRKGCELPADAALCFFQLRLTCVYGTSSFLLSLTLHFPSSFHFNLFHATSQAENCAFENRVRARECRESSTQDGGLPTFNCGNLRLTGLRFFLNSAAPRLKKKVR